MTDRINSPFLVVEHFVSPATCDSLIQKLGVSQPSVDETGRPLKSERILNDAEHITLLKGLVQQQVGAIEEKYDATVVGMEPPVFQQYFENPKDACELHGCENAKFMRKKWVKVKDVDLVGYLWLKDFNSGIPLDPRIETYGGKLEFPAYNFSLVPQRGTLVLFPAGPHFITAISPILVGSLEQIKFTIKLKENGGGMWIYQPANFPGDFTSWFNQE